MLTTKNRQQRLVLFYSSIFTVFSVICTTEILSRRGEDRQKSEIQDPTLIRVPLYALITVSSLSLTHTH